MIDKYFIYSFIRKNRYAVVSSISAQGLPEAALVGIVATPDLKIFFDTVTDSRKYKNLLRNPAAALVIGWDHEQTLQYEGIARAASGLELEEMKHHYFEIFPDGRDRVLWKNIAYFVIDPKWVRFSDYSGKTPVIEELAL